MSETLKEKYIKKISLNRGWIFYHRIFDKWGGDYGAIAANVVLF